MHVCIVHKYIAWLRNVRGKVKELVARTRHAEDLAGRWEKEAKHHEVTAAHLRKDHARLLEELSHGRHLQEHEQHQLRDRLAAATVERHALLQDTETQKTELAEQRAQLLGLQHRHEALATLAAEHSATLQRRDAAIADLQRQLGESGRQGQAAERRHEAAAAGRQEAVQKIEIQARTIYELHQAVEAVGGGGGRVLEGYSS